MEVELNVRKTGALTALMLVAVLVVLAAPAALGRAVTPVGAAGEPELLTPARWKAYTLARQARTETVALVRDLKVLQALVEQEHPDPVEAMLAAGQIYAKHRRGTAATAAARNALIQAAEQTALWAGGAVSKDEAVESVNRAVRAVEPLVELYVEER